MTTSTEEGWANETPDQIFDEIDINGDGSLSLAEVETAMKKARVPTQRGQVRKLFLRIDTDNNGTISREEFSAFINERREQLRSAFNFICDAETCSSSRLRNEFNSGMLREAALRTEIVLADDDVRIIMNRLDANHDGVVTFDEFVEAMMLVPSINPRAYFDQWFRDCFVDDSGITIVNTESPAVTAGAKQSFSEMVAKKLVCGGTAGFLSRSLTAPIDRLRMIMMTSKTPLTLVEALRHAVNHPLGFRAMWLGNGVNCLKITPEMGIKLVTFDLVRKRIAADEHNVSTTERFIAGGVAGALSQTTIYPMEVFRTRLGTAPPGKYNGIAHCAKEVVRTGGFGALYAGVGPNIVGIIPFAAIDLTLMSVLKERAASHLVKKGEEVSVPMLLGCGMISSAVATTATFPLNVLRTRAQATGDPVGKVFAGVRTEGLRGFYRGLVPCLGKVVPATAISYAAYDKLEKWWR